MASDRRYRLLLTLFGTVLACSAVSASRGWMRGLAPYWAACCFSIGMLAGPGWAAWGALIGGAAGAGLLLFGLGVLLSRARRTSRFVSGLLTAAAAPPARLARLTADLGLSRHVVVLATEAPLAFCFGFVRPRICLSTGLAEALGDDELRAVLLHEDHHRRRFDPLRGLLLGVAAKVFFFLPVVPEACDWLTTRLELEADRHAVRAVGRPSLAGALHTLLTHPLAVRIPMAGIAGLSATEARIAELLGDRPAVLRLSGRSLIATSAVLLVACVLAPGPLV